MTVREKVLYLKKLGWRQASIAGEVGISRQRVHQILTGYKSPIQTRIYEEKRKRGLLLQDRINKIKKSVFNSVPEGNISQLTGMKGSARERNRELIRIRDNHTCQSCGLVWEKGMRRLDVHHLDEDSSKTRQVDNLEVEASNMVTLCHSCHLGLPGHRKKMRLSKVHNSKTPSKPQ